MNILHHVERAQTATFLTKALYLIQTPQPQPTKNHTRTVVSATYAI